MSINNTQGAGRVASVAWTPLDGTGLSAQERATVDDRVDASGEVVSALLAAAKQAVNRGWSSFRLDDLAALGQLKILATGDESAADWAAFIGKALGATLSAADAYSLNDWKRTADAMQGYAAMQASRRNPAGGADGDGGVTHANGQWYANGQALSLLDLFTAARVNLLANYDDTIDGYLQELQDNQRLLKAAREWGSILRNKKPTGGGDPEPKTTLTSADVAAFKWQWSIDPIQTFTNNAQVGVASKAEQWDIWLTQLTSYVDLKDTANQTLQGQIDQKANRRSEVIEAMTSFAKKESKTGSLMAAALG
jgi:hypothetical protein